MKRVLVFCWRRSCCFLRLHSQRRMPEVCFPPLRLKAYAIIDEHISTITGARGEIYLMFPIESPLWEGAFFYMEKEAWSLSKSETLHYYYRAYLVLPCKEECVCTSNVEEMIRKAEETYSEDPRVCHVCNGRRSVWVPTESGEICQLCEGSGIGMCSACWGAGDLNCPLFVMEVHKGSKCPYCGGEPIDCKLCGGGAACSSCMGMGVLNCPFYDSEEHAGSECSFCGGERLKCKICEGAGRAGQCTYCNCAGAKHRSEQCATCEGTGRK